MSRRVDAGLRSWYRTEGMFAIIESGGKQYRVAEGDIIRCDLISDEVGSDVTFDRVVLAGNDDSLKVGNSDARRRHRYGNGSSPSQGQENSRLPLQAEEARPQAQRPPPAVRGSQDHENRAALARQAADNPRARGYLFPRWPQSISLALRSRSRRLCRARRGYRLRRRLGDSSGRSPRTGALRRHRPRGHAAAQGRWSWAGVPRTRSSRACAPSWPRRKWRSRRSRGAIRSTSV